jgi:hypothetical protein
VRTAGFAAASLVAVGMLPTAAIAAPVDVIEACASSASPTLTGIDKFAAVCPDLESAITSTGLDRLLPRGWRERLSTAQLHDLVGIVDRYAAANARATPSTESLGAVLRGLKAAAAPPDKSWWESLKEWLRDWLARSDSAFAKLLRDMAGRVNVSQGALTIVAYCLAAIIGIVALILGIREFQTWAARRKVASGDELPDGQPGKLAATLAEPDQPNSDEVRLSRVLRALVMRLLETGRLSAERSLTHRELVSRSRFDQDGQRGDFAGVTAVAEALVYGPRGAVQSAIPQAIERGESLLAQIQPVTR